MDKFTKVRNIGKGNMGACALARNNEDGKYYVIKQVDLTRMNKKERQQSLNEARVLSSLRHPNVINYVDSFLAKKSDHLCIVMEFADGGDVSSRIKKNYGVNFRESQVLDWFIQLVLSLHYVHQRKILHRDVKTQNVFLTSDNVVKLGDFGIARTLSNTYDQAKTFVGTPYYLSPELILERPYDHRSDVWALGVVLYELLTLKHPFNATDMKGLMQRILKVQYDPIPMIYSTEMRNIVPRLLMKDPTQRIELVDVLRLPVVQRRIVEWLRGDVMPQKYIETLLKQKLLPSELLDRAEAIQQEQQLLVRVKDNGSTAAACAAGGGGAGGARDDACGDSDSEIHVKTNATDPVLPLVSARHNTPSPSLTEEAHTAPPTGTSGQALSRSPADRPSPTRCSNAYINNNYSPHRQAVERTGVSVRRVSRQPVYVAGGGVAGGGGAGGVGGVSVVRPQQRAPSYKYYRTPSTNVNVAPPLYNARHRSHPPTSSIADRATPPLPPRLNSLDNFYQQLNYYQQHRSTAVGAAGNGHLSGNSNGSNAHYLGRASAAAGQQAPYTSRGAAPPAHIPVTVLSSRRVSRKRTEAFSHNKALPSAHANGMFRPPNGGGGGGASSSGGGARSGAPSTLQSDVAGAPDIKAMLQRAAQERAQRRLGGVL